MKIEGLLEFFSHAAAITGNARPKDYAAGGLNRHLALFAKIIFHN